MQTRVGWRADLVKTKNGTKKGELLPKRKGNRTKGKKGSTEVELAGLPVISTRSTYNDYEN